MRLRSVMVLLGVIAASSLVGCGGGSGVPVLPLVPVGGTLLVDDKPLDGILVSFIPDVKTNRRGGAGTTDAAGKFTITDLDQKEPGLPVGKYTVVYSRMRKPDGSAAPDPKPGEPVDPANIRVETLPVHLTTPNPSLPAVEIPPDGKTNLELKISTK